jgi:hypothetical protein
MPPFISDTVHSSGVTKVGWSPLVPFQYEVKPRTKLIAVRPMTIVTRTVADERLRRTR